ncbi:MAG TPA: 2Fe-2S iron-sulfur cluster-binding protein [Phycisphaerales bacterium]|nr:2Fe-2S iron-sulfur cluster-binding protein [Phycisphaerales bacterium]
MHVRPVDPATLTIPVTFQSEDPESLGMESAEKTVMAAVGQNLLEVALSNHVEIEHACGGVCACSTCHIYVEQGQSILSESSEAEEDRVEEAPGLQRNSRLACQCQVLRAGRIVVKVPAWNRNAVKEMPH